MAGRYAKPPRWPRGQAIDFLLSARRDAAAAKRFFRKALAQPHTVNPRTITVDRNPAYPRAASDMKQTGELWRFSQLRQCKYLNNIVEQDHRRIKRLVRPGLSLGSLRTARRTLAGYEVMALIRKGQVNDIGGRDMPAQATFIAGLSGSPCEIEAVLPSNGACQLLQQNHTACAHQALSPVTATVRQLSDRASVGARSNKQRRHACRFGAFADQHSFELSRTTTTSPPSPMR